VLGVGRHVRVGLTDHRVMALALWADLAERYAIALPAMGGVQGALLSVLLIGFTVRPGEELSDFDR
jgi:hypothetical protein